MESSCNKEPSNLVVGFLDSLKSTDSELYLKIIEFKTMIHLDGILGGRYSLTFLLDLFFAFEKQTINLDALMHEVKYLEGKVIDSKTKAASQFMRPPLKGLWHKHYSDTTISGMAKNVKNALNTYSIPFFDKKIKEAEESGKMTYMTVEDIPHLVNDVVSGNLQRRSEEQKMTGEWLIYANNENNNYYLCLAKHGDGDLNIRKRLNSCLVEFPFLNNTLTS